MKARAPRLSGRAILPARLAGRPFTVLDISVEGSFGLVDVELRIGSDHPFQLGGDGDGQHLIAEIVRVTATSAAGGPWRTAVTFRGYSPEVRQQLGALIVKLLREYRRVP
jgi:hypothetical protein